MPAVLPRSPEQRGGFKLRAERKGGDILQEMEKNKGGADHAGVVAPAQAWFVLPLRLLPP